MCHFFVYSFVVGSEIFCGLPYLLVSGLSIFIQVVDLFS